MKRFYGLFVSLFFAVYSFADYTGVITTNISELTFGEQEGYDVAGRLVLSEEIKGNNTSINISSLKQGVYMYRIINGENIIARDRIVKE